MRASKLLCVLGLAAGVLAHTDGHQDHGQHADRSSPNDIPTFDHPPRYSDRPHNEEPQVDNPVNEPLLQPRIDGSSDDETASNHEGELHIPPEDCKDFPNYPECTKDYPEDSIESRQEPCNPLDPAFWQAKRDTTSADILMSDWTRWACSRGVQWACQYPEYPPLDKREDNELPWMEHGDDKPDIKEVSRINAFLSLRH